MNNVIHINKADQIIEQWNGALDKDAAFKTIAFKFFGGDSNKLDSYLQNFGQIVETIKNDIENTEPKETHEYRQLAMF
jgi:hypothetical protein